MNISVPETSLVEGMKVLVSSSNHAPIEYTLVYCDFQCHNTPQLMFWRPGSARVCYECYTGRETTEPHKHCGKAR